MDAWAGLVDGNRLYLRVRMPRPGRTLRLKEAAALPPLKNTCVISLWLRRNAAKSLAISESLSMAESMLAVRRKRIDAEQLADDAPEGVLPVGVVLARFERFCTRHAAKHEDPRVAA